MRIAHLLLAHDRPEQLHRLINRLLYQDDVVFLHLDAKADAAHFNVLRSVRGVYFVEDRVQVRWGAYSIVQATINGLRAIAASNLSINYINLLSGADYPLRPLEGFHKLLENNTGKNYMHFEKVFETWQEAIPRLKKYHLTNYSFQGKYIVQKWMNRMLPVRTIPEGLVPVGRSQWFTISADAAKYVLDYLDTHANVVRFFKLTWAPDELIFQTILYNSRFRETMMNDNLRYTDWSEGRASPKVLDEHDLTAIQASGAWFGRKFDMLARPEVLDALDTILSESPSDHQKS